MFYVSRQNRHLANGSTDFPCEELLIPFSAIHLSSQRKMHETAGSFQMIWRGMPTFLCSTVQIIPYVLSSLPETPLIPITTQLVASHPVSRRIGCASIVADLHATTLWDPKNCHAGVVSKYVGDGIVHTDMLQRITHQCHDLWVFVRGFSATYVSYTLRSTAVSCKCCLLFQLLEHLSRANSYALLDSRDDAAGGGPGVVTSSDTHPRSPTDEHHADVQSDSDGEDDADDDKLTEEAKATGEGFD